MADENKVKISIDSTDTPPEGRSVSVNKDKDTAVDEKNGKQEEVKTDPSAPAVLLVDDDELILQMYRKKLESDGYQVKTANNGNDALAAAEADAPAVICLDVVMAGMSGAEVLKKLKSNPKTKNIPVIMLTNFSDKEEDIKGAKRVGALDYLVKAQTDPGALSTRIRQVINTGK